MNLDTYLIFRELRDQVHTIEASDMCAREEVVETAKQVVKKAAQTVVKLVLKPQVKEINPGRYSVASTAVVMPIGVFHTLMDRAYAAGQEQRREQE